MLFFKICFPVLWYKHVFVLQEESLLADLRDKMTACLVLASCKQYESITFPTLGTGKLKYPPDKVAETMFATAQDFFADMPHSSLQAVQSRYSFALTQIEHDLKN